MEIKIISGHTNLDIVTIPEPAKLLLTGCIPDIESDRSSVGVEHKRMNLHKSARLKSSILKKTGTYLDSEGRDVLLLELSS